MLIVRDQFSIPVIYTNEMVLERLKNGADLMGPGKLIDELAIAFYTK